MIDKNLCQFAIENWQEYKTSITEASKNRDGFPMVENSSDIYNFDKVCKSLFPGKDIPSSADGILCDARNINLIEFKSGFKQKITKDTFNEEEGKCKKIDAVCEEYWKIFWENQDRKIKELINSIKTKAIESYILLEKHIFPLCKNNPNNNSYKLTFTVIVDEDGVDGIEDTLADVAGVEPKTDNALTSIRQSLKRLSQNKDCLGKPYLYDSIEVLTIKDFYNRYN